MSVYLQTIAVFLLFSVRVFGANPGAALSGPSATPKSPGSAAITPGTIAPATGATRSVGASAVTPGSGVPTPVIPAPVISGPIVVDDTYGKRLLVPAPKLAKSFCSDYLKSKLFLEDPKIKAAYLQCLVFYELALRLQNTFSSYSQDSVQFSANVYSITEQDDVGNANQSQNAVAEINRKVAEVNQAYLEKMKELGEKFRKAREDYQGKIGSIYGRAGTDELAEASCSTSQMSSQVPAGLRISLAIAAESQAGETWSSIWRILRDNYKKLREVKTQAEQKSELAKMQAIATGSVFDKRVERAPENANGPQPLTPMESLVASWAQDHLKKLIQRVTIIESSINPAYLPTVSAVKPVVSSVVGGGIVLAVEYYNNKKIAVPEALASLAGVLNPSFGAGASFAVASFRTAEARLDEYQNFSQQEIIKPDNKDLHLTALEIVSRWGAYKKEEKCLQNVKQELGCIEKRKNTPAYFDQGSCSLNPLNRSN